MSDLAERKRKLEELKRRNQEKAQMMNTVNKQTHIQPTSNAEKVNEILEKVKLQNSIKAEEELVRGNDEENPNSIGFQHRTSKISNKISIVTFSDSILGKTPETFVEEIQCDLYAEINAELEIRVEEELANKPGKENQRNYGYLKKVRN